MRKVVLITALFVCFISIAIPDKTKPGLFNKDPEANKMVIKNNIGYHFKRVIREVNREMFISRRINLRSMINGIQALKQARDSLRSYCNTFPVALQRAAVKAVPTTPRPTPAPQPKQVEKYQLFTTPYQSTYSIAKAECAARGLQLPEVYTANDISALSTFMTKHGLDRCHVGAELDLTSSIIRFTSTGLPLWKSYVLPRYEGKLIDYVYLIDDGHARLFYAQNGSMIVLYDHHGPVSHKTVGDDTFWANNQKASKMYVDHNGYIICTPKYTGVQVKLVDTGWNEAMSSKANRGKRSVAADLLAGLDIEAYASSQDEFEPMDPNESVQMNLGDFQVPTPEATSYSPRAEPDVMEDQHESVFKRDTASAGARSHYSSTIDLCESIVEQANETYWEHRKRMEQLLSLVDISLHYNDEMNDQPSAENDLNQDQPKDRPKRNPIVKFFFKTGLGMLWNIYGFVQDINTQRRISKLEKTMITTQANISANSNDIRKNAQAIEDMTRLISDHSFAIEKLQLVTDDLDQRLTKMETNVILLNAQVQFLNDHVQVLGTIILIGNLVTRIDSSLSSGYRVLESITHSSLLGQTSPLVLPADQVKLVQEDLYKVSSAVLDPSFSRMHSIIVSDPRDNSYLMVVVNAAAVSRAGLELVEMTAIPTYGSSHTYVPILDHNVVALDQYSATFSVLSQQEFESCLDGRCYIGNTAQPVTSKSCGIPQFFDRHLNVCEKEIISSDGMFLQAAMPDGYFYSFKEEVTAQLFCRGKRSLSSSRKIRGIGVLQLPTGCELSVTNHQGHNLKVKGQPKFHLVNADDIDLSTSDLYSSQQDPKPVDDDFKLPQEAAMEQHLLYVQQAVASANERMSAQTKLIIIIVSSLGAVIVIIIVVMIILYYKSRRFRKKFNGIRETIHELGNQINNQQDQAPLIPPRPVNVSPLRKIRSHQAGQQFAYRFKKHNKRRSLSADAQAERSGYLRAEDLDMGDPSEDKVERIYVNAPYDRSRTRSPGIYPHVPSIREVKKMAIFDVSIEELEKQRLEVDELVQSSSRLASAGSSGQAINHAGLDDDIRK